MLNESDRSPGSNILPPPPETNPLSNPLLRENLRRWAEVYFANPPEHREQAVQELLRHLEAERVPIQAGTGTAYAEPRNVSATAVEESDSRLVRCKVCGHNNSPSQRFCGMCGSEALSLYPGTDEGTHTQLERVPHETWNLDRAPQGTEEQGSEENEAGHWRSESDSGAYAQSVPNGNELSLFQDVSRREPDYDDPDFQYESSPSQSYRFYIGLVLAVMLGGLGYMAWRGTQISAPHQVSPPPPAVAPEAAAPPSPSASEPRQPANSEPNAAAPVKNSDQTPSTRDTTAANTSSPTDASSTKKPVKRTAAAPQPAKAVTDQESSGKGTEELSIAERYLSGANGERRDTAEASKWLWRSIAKHNEQASVLLADLYLRGDGVSKNCDQARVLLDSAARKGIPAAGERLRNLQAFGCQ